MTAEALDGQETGTNHELGPPPRRWINPPPITIRHVPGEIELDSDNEHGLRRYVPALAETGFGAIAIVAGFAWPPAALAALGAPMVGEAVAHRLAAAVNDGEAVLTEEGVTPEDVGEAIKRNDAVVDLLRSSVDGVLTSRDAAHRRALARALARGVKDDAQVEPGVRISRTLAQLDVPEVAALRLLCVPRPERPHPGDDPNAKRYPNTLWPDELRAEWSQQPVVIEEVMAKLVGLGLAYDRAGITFDGLLHWQATDFGRKVMRALQEETDRLSGQPD